MRREVGGPQARRPPARPPAAAARRCCWRAPLGWLVIAYLGSLAVLFVASFWHARRVQRQDRPQATAPATSRRCSTTTSTARSSLRTVSIAAARDDHRHVLAFPIAFYMAKVASPRVRGAARRRGADAAVGELPREGLRVADDAQRGRDPQLGARPVRAHGPGFGNVATWLVLPYLWLPFMILPIYAGLERIPDSLLDASGDLGADAGPTFRRVVLPLALPGDRGRLDLHVLADARRLHHADARRRARSSSATSSTRTSASRTTCRSPRPSPRCRCVVMIVYLLIARRLGAFESL